jgi:hypothetical protein
VYLCPKYPNPVFCPAVNPLLVPTAPLILATSSVSLLQQHTSDITGVPCIEHAKVSTLTGYFYYTKLSLLHA